MLQIVVFISLVYLVIVFTLLFHIKNEWCDLLFRNFTVSRNLSFCQVVIKCVMQENLECRPKHYYRSGIVDLKLKNV